MNLTTKALLVQLSISQWSARKYDKRVSKAVTDSSNATAGAGRFNKALLPNAQRLEAIHKKSTAIRTAYYQQTLPWNMEGTMLLPTDNYMQFMSDFSAMKNEWEGLVNAFVVGYPTLVAAAQQELGSLYNSDDYPPVAQLRERFNMTLNLMPVPSGDFRVSLGDEELEKIKADVEARVKAAGDAAMGDLWKRLYDRVKHIAEKLADPDAIFRESLLSNATELCEILPRLNVADDPDLEQMRCALQATLTGKNSDLLRTNSVVREDTAEKAKAIADKMAAFMGGIA